MLTLILIPLLIAMFLAVNMGGSGTAPAFSVAYGSNLIRRSLIPGFFGLFVFLGAIIGGKEVVKTISRGIIPAPALTVILTSIILLSISLTLFIANLLRVPQSTSQSTVGALVGAALYLGSLKTEKLFCEILPTWFILPLVSFGLTFLVAKLVYRSGLKERLDNASPGRWYEHVPRILSISVCCYVAFAIGANNVANASGPIVSMVINQFGLQTGGDDFLLCMILGTLIIAPCFGIGSSFLGFRTVETTGKGITDFGPLGGVLIALITASLLLVASLTRGIPTSLVQLNAGSIIALGVCKVGPRRIFQKTVVKKIFLVWMIAPVISLALAYFLTRLAAGWGLI